MSQNAPRFDPLQILDSDWRARVWKRWLRSRWLGIEDVPPPPPEVMVAETLPPPPEAMVAETLPPPPAMRTEPPAALTATGSLVREVEARRKEARARFDGIIDRLGGVEDQLESLGKRFALHSVHQRRHDQRVVERMESASEMLERLALALESMQATVTRIEQRLERLERRVCDGGGWLDEPQGRSDLGRRENREASSRRNYEGYEEFSDLDETFGYEPTTGARTTSTVRSARHESAPSSGSSIHGDLAEMSLGTLLAMLELDRRTGVLQVRAKDGRTVSVTLKDGALVGVRRGGVDAEPVEALRDALRFANGQFWFRQSSVEDASGPPRSVGSVLLEASSRNDEASRAS